SVRATRAKIIFFRQPTGRGTISPSGVFCSLGPKDGRMGESKLQPLLDLLHAGHNSARDALLQHSLERFRVIAHRMFHGHNDLRRIAQTDDVVQKALVRLDRALTHVRPADVQAFFGLAARQIRWVLRDLAREAAAAKAIANGGTYPDEQEPQDP